MLRLIDDIDLAKPGQRYTHGWVPITGASSLTKVEKAEANVQAMTKRYGPTHPMTKRARAKHAVAAAQARGQYSMSHPHLEVKRKRAKALQASLLSFLELAPT